MKRLPLIGALLLLIGPVQAFETIEEFDKACSASEDTIILCQAAIQYSAFTYITGILCRLEDDGLLTAEQLTEWWKQNGFNYQQLNAFLKDGINLGLVPYPSCSIEPIP